MGRRPKSLVLAAVEDRGHETPCFVWQRALNSAGYAIVRIGGTQYLVHRLAYEARHGALGKLEPDHLCSVPACVRVEHLEAVTHAVNIRRGRSTPLTPGDVAAIRARLDRGATPIEVAADYPVGPDAIRAIRRGARWAA